MNISRKMVPLLAGVGVSLAGCTADADQSMATEHRPDWATEQIEERVDSLLALMTLEEKVGQMVQVNAGDIVTGPTASESDKVLVEKIKSGAVGSMLNLVGAEKTHEAQRIAVEESRLGIPLLFAFDVIHGHQTMFPISLAMSCSWDMEAVQLHAQVAAREAAAQGLHWTFAPMVDVSRDARWGRVMECPGEDPYLASLLAAAQVRGFQGDLSDPETIAACMKHFAGYGFGVGGRDYNTVDMGRNTLHNMVLPPFKAGLEAGAATFMNAFNEVDGTPATGNIYLQRDLLKGHWGYQGLVVSDWGSITEMIEHGFAADTAEATYKAVVAGSDVDMMGGAYSTELLGLVESGQVSEKLVDDAVRRILRVKFALGLFDDPYKYGSAEAEKRELLSVKNRAASQEVARKSMVLLKNEGGLLPIAEEVKRITVIGQLAADKDTPLGSWRAKAVDSSAVSVLEGLMAAVPEGVTVTYEPGVKVFTSAGNFFSYPEVNETDRTGIDAAVSAARGADLVIAVVGEHWGQSAEAKSRTEIDLPGLQLEMLQAVQQANPNLVAVLMNGRPLELSWLDENVPAILEAWLAGQEAGHAIAEVLTGQYNPSGKLTMSFPARLGQVPVYYNRKNSGRPWGESQANFQMGYRDFTIQPLYPFGHGLSYTTFTYGAMTLSSDELAMDGSLQVSVDVTNAGAMAGEEVVQLYTRDVAASTTRPIQELKGFKKISLAAGETETVSFTLTAEDLKFYNNEGWVAEPGLFHVMVGTNSRQVQQASFVLK